MLASDSLLTSLVGDSLIAQAAPAPAPAPAPAQAAPPSLDSQTFFYHWAHFSSAAQSS